MTDWIATPIDARIPARRLGRPDPCRHNPAHRENGGVERSVGVVWQGSVHAVVRRSTMVPLNRHVRAPPRILKEELDT